MLDIVSPYANQFEAGLFVETDFQDAAARCSGRIVFLAVPFVWENAVQSSRAEWLKQCQDVLLRLGNNGLSVVQPHITAEFICADDTSIPIADDDHEQATLQAINHSNVVLVPDVIGWRKSRGVSAALKVAAKHNKPVYFVGVCTDV